MNHAKKTAEQPAAPKKETKRPSKPGKFMTFFSAIGISSKDMLLNVMPYIFFLAVIGLFYIANSYYSERTIRDIDAITKELKTLRTEYITGKSELMIVSKQSEVARSVAPQGLKESVEAPKKIVLSTPNEKSSD